jgi:MFS transporter, DHA2 family, multidrug resistance protein
VMALLIACGPSLLPESRDPNPGTIDLPSVAMSLSSLLAIVYGVTRMAEHGFGSVAIALVVVGVMVGAVFLRRQQRLVYPLVDLRLFSRPSFRTAFAALLVSVFIIAGTDLFIAQYIQLVHGVSPFITGLWLLPGIIGLIVGSMLAPAVARTMRPGTVITAGLVIAAVGAMVLAQLSDTSSLAVLAAGTTLLGLGCGPIGALGTDILVAAAPPERAGAASAVSETATELGGALGIALLGSLGTAVYRATLAGRLPAGISHSTTATSKMTLGGAVDAAAHLHAQLAGGLLHAANSAFTDGFVVTAAAAAAMTAATAIIAAVTLRNAQAEPSGSQSGGEPTVAALGSNSGALSTVPPREDSWNPCCLTAPASAVHPRPWPATTEAVHPETKGSSTRPIRRRLKRSSRR